MTYRLFTLLLPLTLLLACGDSSSSQGAADDASMQYQDLSVEEFAGKIGSENTILLDVRTPAETANGVIEGAIELDYQAMQFNFVVASNSGAVRLWQKLGFDIVGTLPNAFNHPELGYVDAYVMYKWLSER